MSACARTQACMAMAAAAPTLIERVEPNCAIDTVTSHAARAASDRPGALLAEEQHALARQVVGLERHRAGEVVDADERQPLRRAPTRRAPSASSWCSTCR